MKAVHQLCTALAHVIQTHQCICVNLHVHARMQLHIGGAHYYMTELNACSSQVDSGLGKGSVIGVIPHDLMPREMSGAAIGELRPVNTMHQRKVIPNWPLCLLPVLPLCLISALSAIATRPAFVTNSLCLNSPRL